MSFKYFFIVSFFILGCSSSDDDVQPIVNPPVIVDSPKIIGKTYYVDASVTSPGDGLSESSAFNTLSDAAKVTIEGDIVLVKNGTYSNFTETSSGKSNGWIVWKNFPGHTPIISFSGWQGIYIKGSFVEINGLTVKGNNANVTEATALNQGKGCKNPSGSYDSSFNGNGIYVDSRKTNSNNPTGEKFHHITIKNCIVYNCGGGGIATIQSDYIIIENCTVYNNAWYSIFGNSGISLYQNYNSDFNTGVKNIIRNNRVYGNKMLIPWAFGGCKITDGNGIILDDFKNTQNSSILGAYQGKTLVENNVVYNNGGRGIHSYLCDNITIVNNTCYQNSSSAEINEGEITVIGGNANLSENCSVYGNIMYARAGKRANTVNNVNSNTYLQKNNLFFNSNLIYDLEFGGKIGNPQFENAEFENFKLLPSSPAIDYGYMLRYYPTNDIIGTTRFKGSSVDCGAYEVN